MTVKIVINFTKTQMNNSYHSSKARWQALELQLPLHKAARYKLENKHYKTKHISPWGNYDQMQPSIVGNTSQSSLSVSLFLSLISLSFSRYLSLSAIKDGTLTTPSARTASCRNRSTSWKATRPSLTRAWKSISKRKRRTWRAPLRYTWSLLKQPNNRVTDRKEYGLG